MASKPKNPAKKVAKKRANGYEAPKKLPLDSIITDLSKKQWKIGPSIGSGGFGEIYSACKADAPVKKHSDYPYVVKIEPHGNGPLFVEMHFYMRVGKAADIETFKKDNSLKSFGMPAFISNGSHELEGVRHRFLVMERYGKDIWQTFLDQGRKFPEHTIYRIALQMLYVLEYIHKQTYVHADLKGANILTGFGKDADKQLYLVDFGLASHYTSKDYKPDPKKMHNGTIEYTSRDAHNGVPTMRGDLEILAYNLVQWHCGFLPWEKQNLLGNPAKVQEAKEDCMKNIDKFMKTCFDKTVPAPILAFVKYVAQLKYDERPDYPKVRKMFLDGLKSLGKTDSGPLEFSAVVANGKPEKKLASKAKKQKPAEIPDSSPEVVPTKRPRTKKVDSNDTESSPEKKKSRKRPDTPEEATTSKETKTTTQTSTRTGTVVLNSESNAKKKKKIEVNLELDISIDADVVINLHRKDKKKESKESSKKTSEKTAKQKEHADINDSVEEIPNSEDENVSIQGRLFKKSKKDKKESVPQRVSPRRLNLLVSRAGEYKGKKAKN